MATFDDWLDAYEIVYDALPGLPDIGCPNCKHKTLRLVFTGDMEQGTGYAHFWCDTCLHGIGISRAPIPEGGVVRDIHRPIDERRPEVPNFHLVTG